MVSWISDFMTEAATLTGAAPIIYTSTDWWNKCTANSTAFGGDLLWIASYSAGTPTTLPASWSTWSFWQYTSVGSVNGISGAVDLDYFNGSLVTLSALAGLHVSTPAPIVWTGNAVLGPAADSSGTVDYWWQGAGPGVWHLQQVAAAGGGVTYKNPAIVWTGNAVLVTATDSSGNLDYWWAGSRHRDLAPAAGRRGRRGDLQEPVDRVDRQRGATVLGSVVAIREEVPGRPLGVGVPLSVTAGVAADRGPV